MSRVRFVRHSESLTNIGGDESVAVGKDQLTEVGRKQAKAFAKSYRKNPSVIASSTAIRTKETAEPLRQRYHDAKFEVWPEICEFRYVVGGLTPEAHKRIRFEYWQMCNPGIRTNPECENFTEFVSRVDQTIEKVRKLNVENAVIFSHAKFMRLLILRLIHNKNVDLPQLMESLKSYSHRFDYCGWFEVDVTKSGQLSVIEF